jgi:hypothetical protein
MDVFVIIIACSLLSFGSLWLAKMLGAPIYFAKFLCILFAFIFAYFLAKSAVSETNGTWGIYLLTIICGGTLSVIGIEFIEDEKKE